jgi:hypothetical protein
MSGLLPSAILDSYDFWQNEDDGLIGYPRRKEDGTVKEQLQSVIKVGTHLHPRQRRQQTTSHLHVYDQTDKIDHRE